jgi:two-component system, cell cycle response regulator
VRASRPADDSSLTLAQPALVNIAPRVLVVDDDEIAAELVGSLITNAGYEVVIATSGEQALATLKKDFAPIIILDRNMPGMDGLTLCRAIRDGSHYPGYVYIMLRTAQDAEEEILAGLDAGADDYLSKRSSGAQLLARLATARRILSLEHSLKLALEERRRMAMTDVLTGCHNRRWFMSQLRREIKRARRFGGDVTLIVVDVDHFKQINDRHGHAAGDAVLIEVVNRLQKALPREYDWCARIGGEEFAVVLPQTDIRGGAIVAERLRTAISAEPIVCGSITLRATVSLGVSCLELLPDRDGATVEQILRRADDCLYASKKAGRDRITVDAGAATT